MVHSIHSDLVSAPSFSPFEPAETHPHPSHSSPFTSTQPSSLPRAHNDTLSTTLPSSPTSESVPAIPDPDEIMAYPAVSDLHHVSYLITVVNVWITTWSSWFPQIDITTAQQRLHQQGGSHSPLSRRYGDEELTGHDVDDDIGDDFPSSSSAASPVTRHISPPACASRRVCTAIHASFAAPARNPLAFFSQMVWFCFLAGLLIALAGAASAYLYNRPSASAGRFLHNLYYDTLDATRRPTARSNPSAVGPHSSKLQLPGFYQEPLFTPFLAAQTSYDFQRHYASRDFVYGQLPPFVEDGYTVNLHPKHARLSLFDIHATTSVPSQHYLQRQARELHPRQQQQPQPIADTTDNDNVPMTISLRNPQLIHDRTFFALKKPYFYSVVGLPLPLFFRGFFTSTYVPFSLRALIVQFIMLLKTSTHPVQEAMFEFTYSMGGSSTQPLFSIPYSAYLTHSPDQYVYSPYTQSLVARALVPSATLLSRILTVPFIFLLLICMTIFLTLYLGHQFLHASYFAQMHIYLPLQAVYHLATHVTFCIFFRYFISLHWMLTILMLIVIPIAIVAFHQTLFCIRMLFPTTFIAFNIPHPFMLSALYATWFAGFPLLLSDALHQDMITIGVVIACPVIALIYWSNGVWSLYRLLQDKEQSLLRSIWARYMTLAHHFTMIATTERIVAISQCVDDALTAAIDVVAVDTSAATDVAAPTINTTVTAVDTVHNNSTSDGHVSLHQKQEQCQHHPSQPQDQITTDPDPDIENADCSAQTLFALLQREEHTRDMARASTTTTTNDWIDPNNNELPCIQIYQNKYHPQLQLRRRQQQRRRLQQFLLALQERFDHRIMHQSTTDEDDDHDDDDHDSDDCPNHDTLTPSGQNEDTSSQSLLAQQRHYTPSSSAPHITSTRSMPSPPPLTPSIHALLLFLLPITPLSIFRHRIGLLLLQALLLLCVCLCLQFFGITRLYIILSLSSIVPLGSFFDLIILGLRYSPQLSPFASPSSFPAKSDASSISSSATSLLPSVGHLSRRPLSLRDIESTTHRDLSYDDATLPLQPPSDSSLHELAVSSAVPPPHLLQSSASLTTTPHSFFPHHLSSSTRSYPSLSTQQQQQQQQQQLAQHSMLSSRAQFSLLLESSDADVPSSSLPGSPVQQQQHQQQQSPQPTPSNHTANQQHPTTLRPFPLPTDHFSLTSFDNNINLPFLVAHGSMLTFLSAPPPTLTQRLLRANALSHHRSPINIQPHHPSSVFALRMPLLPSISIPKKLFVPLQTAIRLFAKRHSAATKPTTATSSATVTEPTRHILQDITSKLILPWKRFLFVASLQQLLSTNLKNVHIPLLLHALPPLLRLAPHHHDHGLFNPRTGIESERRIFSGDFTSSTATNNQSGSSQYSNSSLHSASLSPNDLFDDERTSSVATTIPPIDPQMMTTGHADLFPHGITGLLHHDAAFCRVALDLKQSASSTSQHFPNEQRRKSLMLTNSFHRHQQQSQQQSQITPPQSKPRFYLPHTFPAAGTWIDLQAQLSGTAPIVDATTRGCCASFGMTIFALSLLLFTIGLLLTSGETPFFHPSVDHSHFITVQSVPTTQSDIPITVSDAAHHTTLSVNDQYEFASQPFSVASHPQQQQQQQPSDLIFSPTETSATGDNIAEPILEQDSDSSMQRDIVALPKLVKQQAAALKNIYGSSSLRPGWANVGSGCSRSGFESLGVGMLWLHNIGKTYHTASPEERNAAMYPSRVRLQIAPPVTTPLSQSTDDHASSSFLTLQQNEPVEELAPVVVPIIDAEKHQPPVLETRRQASTETTPNTVVVADATAAPVPSLPPSKTVPSPITAPPSDITDQLSATTPPPNAPVEVGTPSQIVNHQPLPVNDDHVPPVNDPVKTLPSGQRLVEIAPEQQEAATPAPAAPSPPEQHENSPSNEDSSQQTTSPTADVPVPVPVQQPSLPVPSIDDQSDQTGQPLTDPQQPPLVPPIAPATPPPDSTASPISASNDASTTPTPAPTPPAPTPIPTPAPSVPVSPPPSPPTSPPPSSYKIKHLDPNYSPEITFQVAKDLPLVPQSSLLDAHLRDIALDPSFMTFPSPSTRGAISATTKTMISLSVPHSLFQRLVDIEENELTLPQKAKWHEHSGLISQDELHITCPALYWKHDKRGKRVPRIIHPGSTAVAAAATTEHPDQNIVGVHRDQNTLADARQNAPPTAFSTAHSVHNHVPTIAVYLTTYVSCDNRLMMSYTINQPVEALSLCTNWAALAPEPTDAVTNVVKSNTANAASFHSQQFFTAAAAQSSSLTSQDAPPFRSTLHEATTTDHSTTTATPPTLLPRLHFRNPQVETAMNFLVSHSALLQSSHTPSVPPRISQQINLLNKSFVIGVVAFFISILLVIYCCIGTFAIWRAKMSF